MALQPLSGVRIVDFTRVLAGPFCTMTLADLGAEVIKIESAHGDETRQWGPPWLDTEEGQFSAYYLGVNRGKRSIAIDLKKAEGQSIAKELIQQAHVLVENFKVGGMSMFGLGYEQVKTYNPALVYASITGYGQTGPYRDRPGYDFVIQGQSGLMSITGEPEGEPMKVGVAVSDVFAGLFAATSILGALRYAEQTGQGQHLDIALLDTQIAALVNIVSGALVSEKTPARYGNAHPSIVPYQPFQASDQAFTLAVGNDRQFAQLCKLIGRDDLLTDTRFVTNPARVANRETLIHILSAVFRTRTAQTWVEDLLALNIPAGLINTVDQTLADPHIMARGLIGETDFYNQALRWVNFPVQFSETPSVEMSPPPRIGQDTETILRDVLGKTDIEIRALYDQYVVS